MADIDITNLDAGTDSPRLARQQILDAVRRVNDLAATTSGKGAALLATKSPVSGAVDTTQQALNDETISVVRMGADPTGTADSTAAFNAAIASGKKVLVPQGTYRVANVAVVSFMDIEGESRSATTLLVASNNAGAFLHSASAHRYNVRIANMTIAAASGVTGACAYKQSSMAYYTAYAQFENVETEQSLLTSYLGYFIYARWLGGRDGYQGNAPVGQQHNFITSIPAAFGQTEMTNLNQVLDCQTYRSTSGANAVIDIAYGNLWAFDGSSFENHNCPAIRARGIYSGSLRKCWFENNACTSVIQIDISPTPNAQGSYPWTVHDCFVDLTGCTVSFLSAGSASYADIRDVNFARVPSGVLLFTSSTTPDVVTYGNCSALSGAGIATFFVRAYTPIQNVNMLPIGPSGLGQANFTASGCTKADVASGIGLAGNAISLTLGASGNYIYYSLPAKIVTFLRGRAVTVAALVYAGTANVADGVFAMLWDSVTPSFVNGLAGAVSGDVANANLQCISGTNYVGAAASSLHVGILCGGSNNTKTLILEALVLYVGGVSPVTISLH